ncbi:MAG TPA: RcpC/CpaB family pilus assembly protein [Nocardioides sp.]|nr:RcpC/CpaB family pilus assembly protein [Nocardioides sp.]
MIAALGVALVFVYAKGADDRAAQKYDTVDVLTVAAGKTILPGESIDAALQAGKIVKAPVPKDQLLDGASADTTALKDKIALTTLYAGEQVIPSKFGGVGDELDVVSLPLPTGTIGKFEQFDLPIGTFILPGSQVAVFVTVAGQPSCLLIDRVPVIAVGASTSAAGTDNVDNQSNGTEADNAPPLTLAVTQRQFELLESAKTLGTMTVGLLNSESKVRAGSCAAGLIPTNGQ